MNPITLTDAKLTAMKPPASGQIEISDSVVPGLRVRLGVSGGRTFIVRKRIGGKVKNITLGRYSARFGLAEARKKARTILSDIEAGGDPSAGPPARKREATGNTERCSRTIRPLRPTGARSRRSSASSTAISCRILATASPIRSRARRSRGSSTRSPVPRP